MTTPNDPSEGNSTRGAFPSPPPIKPDLSDTKAAAPKSVTMSFWLWIAASVLSVVSSLLAFGQRDEAIEVARRELAEAGQSTANAETLVNTGMIILVVFYVIVAALFILFAFKARAGRNWARIVLTVFGVIGLLLMVFGFTVISLIIALLIAAAIVLLYVSGSNAYFNQPKQLY